MKALIVTEPFGKYPKGAKITDAAEIKLATEKNPHQVVAINEPDPAPVAKAPAQNA